MTALISDFNRATKAWLHVTEKYPLKAATLIYQGALVAIESATGYLVNAANTIGLEVIGISEGNYDNSAGANGDLWADVTVQDLAKLETTGATQAWVGKMLYIVDDNTVSLADPGNGIKAGICHVVESSTIVWVWVGVGKLLPSEKRSLSVYIPDISTASTFYILSPFAGEIVSIKSVLEGTIATADAVLTPTINATAITDGAITVANGSVAGDIDSATPSALNVLAAGDYISIATDGGSTNAVGVHVTFTIREA